MPPLDTKQRINSQHFLFNAEPLRSSTVFPFKPAFALHIWVKTHPASAKNERSGRPDVFSRLPWPFPNSLTIAFLADYAGGMIRPAPNAIKAADRRGAAGAPKPLPSEKWHFIFGHFFPLTVATALPLKP
jgi:hypothetical protein